MSRKATVASTDTMGLLRVINYAVWLMVALVSFAAGAWLFGVVAVVWLGLVWTGRRR